MSSWIRNSGFCAAVCALTVVPSLAQAGALLDYYQLAVKNDQTLLAARFTRDGAEEARPTARSALLPQLTAKATIQRNHFEVLSVNDPLNTNYKELTEAYNSKTYSLQLTQTIFDWAAFKSLSVADSSVAQAEADYESARINLVTRYVTAYFAVLTAQDTLRADLEGQSAFKQQLQQQSSMFKSGLGSVTDVKNAQAAYDGSVATVVADKLNLSSAKRALSVIVGQPVETVDALRDEIPLVAPNPPQIDNWVTSAKANNIDVISAGFAVEAAKRKVSAYGGQRLPTLSLVGSLSRDDSDSTFGYNSQTNYIGLNLNWALYSGGKVSSSIRQAEAAQNQAAANYVLKVQTADQNVRNHYDGVVGGIESIKASNNAVNSQQASVVATTVGYKVGSRTVIDMLNSQQQLITAEKNLTQARYNYLLSLLNLKADVGQLVLADLEDLDQLTVGGLSAIPVNP